MVWTCGECAGNPDKHVVPVKVEGEKITKKDSKTVVGR